MYEHKNGVKYRKAEECDLGGLFDLKQESWWGTHGAPIMNVQDQKDWFKNLDNRTLVMVAQVFIAQENSVHEFWNTVGVGIYSNFDWVARTCDISGSIFKGFRGTEHTKNAFECGLDFGFEMLNMHRIQAEVVEYNLAAQKLEIDHLGFTVEGRRRSAVYKAGEYYDSIILGILRDEWYGTKCDRDMENGCNKNVDHEKLSELATEAMDL